MAKHMETMEEACANLWKLMDGVNKGFKGEAKDAEQYHDIIASLYKLKGLEMAAQYEEEQGGASQRGGGSYRGNSYDNGYSGLYFDPMAHMSMRGGSYDNGNSYAQGGSYGGNSYNQGGSYNGGYSGNGGYSHGGGSYGGGSYDNGDMSGRYQPRNAQGQFKADGYSNRGSYGSSYHSQQDLIMDLREQMQDADPETQRAYRKVIRDMQM